MLRIVLLGICISGPALGQTLRPGDEPLSKFELESRLSGQVVEFFDDSQAFYEADGLYRYRYQPDDPPFVGKWEATNDGTVCVTFENGFGRCDTYVVSRKRLTMIIANGDRYPARSETPIE